MSTQATLFFRAFPYGLRELWKLDDVQAFSQSFDRVRLVPYLERPGAAKSNELPDNVEVLPAIFAHDERSNLRLFAKFLFSRIAISPLAWKALLTQIFERNKWGFAAVLKTLADASVVTSYFRRHGILTSAKPETLFFFWGLCGGEALPFVSTKHATVAMGFHAFDLYDDRAGAGFFPLRREIFEACDILAPCSDFGTEYLRQRHPALCDRITTKRLGVRDFGVSAPGRVGPLHLVSCALLQPHKRIDLLIDALAEVRAPFRWTHIGGGDALPRLQALAREKLGSRGVAFEMVGQMEASDVRRYMQAKKGHALISVSASEGVPVTIMEALSAGMPVIATDVGGCRELVDSDVGVLLPAHPSVQEIVESVEQLASLSDQAFADFQQRARARADARCRAPMLSDAFVVRLREVARRKGL
jgi:glycosyltransferase involved in cell wall biosynthesis